MKTYPVQDQAGNFAAFELENAYISIRKMQEILSSVSGVSNLRRRRLFQKNEEFRLAFDYLETSFLVLEPFGDSSRYWVGPATQFDSEMAEKIRNIESAFKNYVPPLLVKIPADIVTLKFLRSRKRSG